MKYIKHTSFLVISTLAFFMLPVINADAGATCPAATPHKCPDGQCVKSISECRR